MGYALENFNAIGQWQDSEGATPVDASGIFPDGTAFNGVAQFRAALLDRREAFLHTMANKLRGYALNPSPGPAGIRGVEVHEMPAVRRILREAVPLNYRWSGPAGGSGEERAVSKPKNAMRLTNDENFR